MCSQINNPSNKSSFQNTEELSQKISVILSRKKKVLTENESQLIFKYIYILLGAGYSKEEIASQQPFKGLPKEGVLNIIEGVAEQFKADKKSGELSKREKQGTEELIVFITKRLKEGASRTGLIDELAKIGLDEETATKLIDVAVKYQDAFSSDTDESVGSLKQEESASSLKPDLGLYIMKNNPNVKTLNFLPFKIFHIAQIKSNLYTTSANISHEGSEFCMSLDFNKKILAKLMDIFPAQIAEPIKGLFRKPSKSPRHINLPFPVEVGVSVKLGKKTYNEDEEFAPFEVEDVFPVNEGKK